MLVTVTVCSLLPGVYPSLGHPLCHLTQSALAGYLRHSSIKGVTSLGQGVTAITVR